MCQDVVFWGVGRSAVAYGVVGYAYGLSDKICCSVHALLWIFPCLSILVRLRLPRLGQPAEISIQRWTFCKDIVLLVVWRGVVNNKIVNCFGFKSVFLIMILNNRVN